ncbi:MULTISPECIES: hypothetical protein [Vibrio]|jgi:hypothetical protein|uniref:hypothetical protein n=1 Tax=Vibrio TaxID=662 RepID=UPI000B34AE12|nr:MULTISPECIES: hypothetical protein [Vibrio]MCY9865495.1 hypothetical protein [Vibrio coralliirubri]PMK23281.1 hypothetical protein BCU05_09540 [Vibrio sp. 10N.261.54.C3]PMO08880.1 hypothetical protein BCT20_04660 [Vibrio sp. 10N.222.55.C12]PMO10854.1 hypothetical protein BCT17_17675 [Vibrio sp. 10N.222.54.F10]PMO22670.1 hypothetical protein BCT16_00795 [Vibrio sp. 10N.222.54.B6]
MFGKRYYLEQLNKQENDLLIDRNSIKIAIIDDMEVPYLDSLRRSGYNVQHYKDIEDFDMLKAYSVIVCDIKGVGKSFGSKLEGAYIIKEARKLYPEKYIIAMSSAVYKISVAKVIGVADDKIIRDIDLDKVLDSIDTAVNTMRSNRLRWLRLRDNLLNTHNVDMYDVWKIEQAFIAAMINKDKTKLEKNKTINHANDMVKGLLINFISGIIF